MSGSNQDKSLADRVVALGVGEQQEGMTDYELRDEELSGARVLYFAANEFVKSWLVTGALMEKCIKRKIVPHFSLPWESPITTIQLQMISLDSVYGNENHPKGVSPLGCGELHKPEDYPRAIIEACVEVLERV